MVEGMVQCVSVASSAVSEELKSVLKEQEALVLLGLSSGIHSAKRYSRKPGPKSQSMETLRRLHGKQCLLSMSSQEDSPASPLVLQENEKGAMMNVTSGQNVKEPLELSNQKYVSLKTCQDSSQVRRGSSLSVLSTTVI